MSRLCARTRTIVFSSEVLISTITPTSYVGRTREDELVSAALAGPAPREELPCGWLHRRPRQRLPTRASGVRPSRVPSRASLALYEPYVVQAFRAPSISSNCFYGRGVFMRFIQPSSSPEIA